VIECPWQKEEINSTESLLRHIPPLATIKEGSRRYPGPDHFSLREDIGETYISFNWEKYADVNCCHILIGISYGTNGEFRKPDGVIHFKYPVEFLKSVPKFEKIEHIPIWIGNPSPIGMPNNKAHVGLFCTIFDIGTRSILSEFCHQNHNSKMKADFNIIREAIEGLKARGNETPYHRDWIFDA
jgi:hypothetical protein